MHSRRVWLRFSLATLLFLVFCLAGFFAGFYYGAKAGRSYWRGESQEVRLYNVSDLLSPGGEDTQKREFAALIARIQNAVGPSLWREVGGTGYVQVHNDGMHLEVLCPWKDHRQVKQAIVDLREQRRRDGEQFQLADDNDAAAVRPPVGGKGTF